MRHLLAAHERGLIEPVPVELGGLPRHARRIHRDIAADMATRMGLMLADCDDRPLAYACSEAVHAGWAANDRQANDAIKWLLRHGVVVPADPPTMPRRPGAQYATRLFRAPGASLEGFAVSVEAGTATNVLRPPVEPGAELEDQPCVLDAECGGSGLRGGVARASGALGEIDGGLPHASDHPALDGGIEAPSKRLERVHAEDDCIGNGGRWPR